MSIIDSIKKIFSVSASTNKPKLEDFVKIVRTKGGESVVEIDNSSSITFGGEEDSSKDEEVIWGKKKQP
ncbi:MAG: hypothetical protein Q7R42_08895 [Candidatus Planktophila sp.]|nr:hypothetical protein [Candidatus Planktophila sp.]